jgi:hypothetical protein
MQASPLPDEDLVSRAALALVMISAITALLAGCEPNGQGGGSLGNASASPNASILPAPLATEPPELADAGQPGDAGPQGIPADVGGRLLVSDGGAPPPEALRPATALVGEGIPFQKDAAGLSLDAVFRWRDVPAPPRAPEVSADGLREAQKVTAFTLKVDLSDAGRMRAELTGRAFPLPAHTELRARTDYYGTLLLGPNATEYRVIPPGALRPLLGERRVDVTPLSAGTVRAQGEGRRLGVVVRKVEVGSSVATVKLELGKVPEAGEGGALLCRALVELGGVDPRSPVCVAGEVPLAAQFSWQEGGGIGFEVTALQKRTDLPAANLLCPPPTLRLADAGLPTVPQGIFLSREELVAFRTVPLQLPPVRDPNVPGEGFVAVNDTDRLLYLLLDGVAVVAVPPHADRYVIGPPRGRYLAQWRTFLGEKVLPNQPVEMPARIAYGQGHALDAGAPDGG